MINISSTNRSNARQEHFADYYITPIDCIELFLNEFEKSESIFQEYPIILDACAGGDSQHPMSYPTAINNLYHLPVDTIDIREDSLAEIKADFLIYEIKNKPNIIITNPPFSLALPMVKKALNDVADNGFVIMLLRLNFLESKERKEFFNENMPKYIYCYSKRMSFTDKGGTDSCAYAHFVWQKGYNPTFSLIKVI